MRQALRVALVLVASLFLVLSSVPAAAVATPAENVQTPPPDAGGGPGDNPGNGEGPPPDSGNATTATPTATATVTATPSPEPTPTTSPTPKLGPPPEDQESVESCPDNWSYEPCDLEQWGIGTEEKSFWSTLGEKLDPRTWTFDFPFF